jgi:molecular chaperone DnaK
MSWQKIRRAEKSKKITITSSSGLSKDDVEKMVKEAEANEEADKHKRELIEARNNLDNQIHGVQKLIKENGDKLPADAVETLENAISSAQDALDSDNLDQMKAATDELMSTAQQVAQMAQESSGSAQDPQASNEPDPDGDVIDVDFEDAD